MRTRRILCFLLSLILCIPAVACAGGGEDSTTDPDITPEPTETELPDICLNGYTLIRAERASEDEISVVSGFRSYLRELGDFDIAFNDDFLRKGTESDPTAPEIVFGLTTRPESQTALSALEGYYDWSVTLVGAKLCVSASTVETLAEAADYLKANTRAEGDKLYYTGKNYTCRKDYPLADAKLGEVKIADLGIVYASDSEREKNVAEALSLDIARLTGKKPALISDSEPESANEILLGSAKRASGVDPASLGRNDYIIAAKGGKLVISAGNTLGYETVRTRLETVMTENKLTEGFEEKGKFEIKGLDGAKVMFVGNSFLYYGYCTTTKNEIVFDDQGYFHEVAEKMGDDVYVTSVTYGGKGFKALYSILTENYPNYYGKGDNMDDFYNQDFVILQQEGSNASSTLEYAEKIMALFPPETRFGFFIHHHNAQNNHTNVLNAAKKLRDEKGVVYISAGHMMFEVWMNKAKVPGATLTYNKNSFVVNHSDSHHPNYLNGYLTALSCYYALTGNSIVDCPHDFVRTTMEYYTKARSNYDDILASEPDMKGLKQLVEQYIDKYNN